MPSRIHKRESISIPAISHRFTYGSHTEAPPLVGAIQPPPYGKPKNWHAPPIATPSALAFGELSTPGGRRFAGGTKTATSTSASGKKAANFTSTQRSELASGDSNLRVTILSAVVPKGLPFAPVRTWRAVIQYS